MPKWIWPRESCFQVCVHFCKHDSEMKPILRALFRKKYISWKWAAEMVGWLVRLVWCRVVSGELQAETAIPGDGARGELYLMPHCQHQNVLHWDGQRCAWGGGGGGGTKLLLDYKLFFKQSGFKKNKKIKKIKRELRTKVDWTLVHLLSSLSPHGSHYRSGVHTKTCMFSRRFILCATHWAPNVFERM